MCARETVWTTMAPADLPRFAYSLTFNDRRFLRQLAIDPEEV
jgi:hypothetical protein